MKGDGKGESEGVRKNGGRLNNEIKVSRRRFIKTSAAFGAAIAGIPYNLTDIADVFLKDDGKLIIYPEIYEFKYNLVRGKPFKNPIIFIELWGCNWNCRWCCLKSTGLKDMIPIRISTDQITGLLLNLGNDTETMIAINGGEPLLQGEETLNLIESLKTKTNYTVMLGTNGSLIDDDFIDSANDRGLDGITIFFHCLDDKQHKWHTGGYSNKDTLKALELVTKKFKGLSVASLTRTHHKHCVIFS